MDVRVKTTDCDLTPETSAYLDERLARLEKVLAGDAALARFEVELGRDAGRPRHGKNVWFAEINLWTPGNVLVRATNHAESLNAAIDDVKEEVERQLLKGRKLHIRIWRRGGAFAKHLLRIEQ